MSDKQVLGIMAAIVFKRLVELEGWSIEDSIKEAAQTAQFLMKRLGELLEKGN